MDAPEVLRAHPSARTPQSRRHVLALALAFVAVHAVLSFIDLRDHVRWPLGDVVGPYAGWAGIWRDSGLLVGIDAPWVYPAGALPPMILVLALGPAHYDLAWLLMVTALDAMATIALARRRPSLAWWWLAFTLCLGPVAVGRIDAVALPFALVAVLLIASRPTTAAVLLTVATWIKVWPVAIVASMLTLGPRRRRVALAVAVTCTVILGLALLAGADANLFAFLGQQTGRALQVESPISWPWLVMANQGVATVYYDKALLTVQVAGPGALETAALMTPLLLLVLVVVFVGSFVAERRGAAAAAVLPYTALASVAALIAVNKVGSPQYMSWLAAPIILGLLVHGRGFSVPAIAALVAAALTQLVYPWFYESLVQVEPWMLGVIGVRDGLEVVILVWATFKIARAVRAGPVRLDGARGAAAPQRRSPDCDPTGVLVHRPGSWSETRR